LAAARAAGAAVLYALAAGTLVSLAGFALTDALFHLMGVPRERSEEHTSELQSRFDLVCRLLLEKKKIEHLLLLLPEPPLRSTTRSRKHQEPEVLQPSAQPSAQYIPPQ